MIKKLKFEEKLIPLILSGEKTATWRLFDDKDLRVGDELVFVNKSTGQEFARARIESVKEKKLVNITASDFVGHEPFASQEEMFADYRRYYGDRVQEDTVVKMINFVIINNPR